MLAPAPAPRGSIQRLAESIAPIRICVKIFHRISVSLLGAEFPIAALRHVIVMRLSHLLPHRTIEFCSAAIYVRRRLERERFVGLNWS